MNVEQEVAALITRVGALERAVFAPFTDHAPPTAAEVDGIVSAQRQRIEAQTLKQRAEAEAAYRKENPDWDAQVAGATPAGSDGPAGDPDTIGIGPKGG
jgi:hypothetical protein